MSQNLYYEAIVVKTDPEDIRRVIISSPVFESYSAQLYKSPTHITSTPPPGTHGILLFQDTLYTDAIFIPMENPDSDSEVNTNEDAQGGISTGGSDKWEWSISEDQFHAKCSGAELFATSDGRLELTDGTNKIKIDGGKIAIGGPAAEFLDLMLQQIDAFINNAPTFVQTGIGPGVLSPPIVTILGTLKTLLTNMKGSI